MKTVNIENAPLAVQKAFEHVKSFFPTLTSVEYDEICHWDFQERGWKSLNFGNVDIDIGILNDAADAQYNIGVPVRYILNTSNVMKFVRGFSGIYFNKRNHDWEWRYKYVMDDYGNLINIERNFQKVVFFYQ
ncbi:hypothetical protein TAC_0172 [Acinetobacter phage TAC1]|nr:hypothetical protein TAC_0172 [Acinetobacter phage TAC1]